jgi:hypothetical protein
VSLLSGGLFSVCVIRIMSLRVRRLHAPRRPDGAVTAYTVLAILFSGRVSATMSMSRVLSMRLSARGDAGFWREHAGAFGSAAAGHS